MSAPSSISSRRTFCPCGPVWCVTSCMPRILPANSRTSSIDFASLTPPPLPRPPAWICAFTTQTLPPIACAALTASSTEKAGMPRGVGMPKRRRISLPWYSWIFTTSSSAGLRRPSVPLRIVPAHRVGGRLERMAAIELKRLAFARFDLAPQSGEHLDRHCWRMHEQLGHVTAAANSSHGFRERPAKAVQQARADELSVRRLDLIAGLVGHVVGPDFDCKDHVVGIDGHARPHVVHRNAGRSHAREQRVIVVFHVGEMALDVEEPVV